MARRPTLEEQAARQQATQAARAKLTDPARPQLTLDDVVALDPADVAEAMHDGRLADLGFGGRKARR